MKKMITAWETKTSQEGTVTIPELPMGEVQIQVIAEHYQTFGDIFQLNQPRADHRDQAESAAAAVLGRFSNEVSTQVTH